MPGEITHYQKITHKLKIDSIIKLNLTNYTLVLTAIVIKIYYIKCEKIQYMIRTHEKANRCQYNIKSFNNE